MAINVHVARVGIFNVDQSRNRIDKNSPATSINQLKYSRQDALVIFDSDNPNTNNFPSIKEYIEAEAASGFSLLYMDASFIITGTNGGTGDTGSLTDAQLRATPVPVSGTVTATGPLTDAQLRATPVPVSGTVTATGPLTDAQLRASRVNTDQLGQPSVARQLAAGVASANTALTSTTRRISIFARNANIRYSIGSSAQTASGTSHYIAQGERLDVLVPATPNIAVIRADSTDGVLELTELT
jgi:hypothetical protein